MSDSLGSHPHFRLNLEQQQKRAKDLLKSARAGDADALARFRLHPPKLAEAQHLIARELRFENWAALKHHIVAMTRERERIETHASASAAAPPFELALDADLRTLHIRCGSDLQKPLQDAGFRGDFHEHSYPYLIGPVREGPGCLEQRARFLVDAYGSDRKPALEYEAVLEHLTEDERRLHESSDYERVVIWSEGDCYDQLVQLRLLAHYAAGRQPRCLELINVRDFPGSLRFIGLGQLPPEALRLLWQERHPVTTAQLSIGLAGWKALASDDPRALAELMRSQTPALPLLAPALHRHLRELPSVENGLGFTQQMALTMLAEQPQSLNRMFGRMTYFVDPLPGQGDSQMRDRVLAMEQAREHLFTRTPGLDGEGRSRPPWTDVLTITELGRAVLAGEVDFQALAPPARWVGGVRVSGDDPDWRWDEARRDVVLGGTNPGKTRLRP
jgi:hypothetical protein